MSQRRLAHGETNNKVEKIGESRVERWRDGVLEEGERKKKREREREETTIKKQHKRDRLIDREKERQTEAPNYSPRTGVI